MSGSPSRTSNLTRHGAGISTLALPGVDIVSMTRGDGEWRNMQEIVRRTLKVAFETIDKQAKQIGRLTGQIASLQSQQQKIVSRDEILELIEERLERSKLTGKKRYVLRPELESMSIAIAQIKQDLERKASMRYVHDVLRGKIDKSDAVARTLLQQSSDDRSTVTATAEYAATANRTQMSMLFKDLATVKDDVEGLAKLIEAISREMKASNEITDYNIVKKQIESIYASMDDYHTKTYVQALLDQKQDAASMDALLRNKAEQSTVEAANQRFERVLEKHEKEITSIRLKLNDGSLFEPEMRIPLGDITNAKRRQRKRHHKKVSFRDVGSSRGRGAAGGGSSSSSNDEGYSSGGESWSMHFKQRAGADGTAAGAAAGAAREMVSSAMSGIASRPGDSRTSHSDIVESSLRGGRIEAVVNGLWQKISHVQSASQHYQKDIRDLQHKITKLQMALDTAAGVKQVETLGVVVEEQRQRIDSLILGSTTIGPIAEEMASIQLQLSELRSYLQLPQAKPLQSQLDEAGELIEVLSRRTAEIGTALGRAATRIETVESRSNHIDNRMQVVEHSASQIASLKHQCDLQDSEYHSAADIGRSLSRLWQCAYGGESTISRCDSAELKLDLLSRVRSLENSSAGQRGELGNLAGRMREMKEVVLTLGRRESKPLRTSAASTQADTEVSVPTQADPAGVGRNENIHPGSTSVADRPTARNLLAPYPPATGAEVPINVDFETAMDQMFLSLDEMQIPVSASAATLSSGRHRSSSTIPLVPPHSPQPAVVTAGSHAGGRPVTVTSLSKVDERLEELKAEKERLRELLLSRVDRP